MLIIDPLDDTLIIDRGDDQELRIPLLDSAGAPLNATGASFLLTVKASIDDPIASAIFQLENPLANGIDVSQVASGFIIANFTSAYIRAMAGEYVYDLQMTFNGKVRTMLPRDGRGAARFLVPKNVSTPGAVTNPAPIIFIFGSIALGADGTLYRKDKGTGLWWSEAFVNGQEVLGGPSASIPF